MKNKSVIDAVERLITPARHILLITHVSPDGDAVGSLLAMGSLLRDQGKKAVLACEDPAPESIAWLPGSSGISRQAGGSFDLVISLDCSDRDRMGNVYEDRLTSVPLLNIDHHITNTQFGTVNWVDPSCAATAQMVLYLAQALGYQVTEPIAVCLLVGLVTDTRSFRTSNVDSAVLRAALQLMEAGASLSQVVRQSVDQQPLAQLRLFADAVHGLRLEDGILWTSVTRAMRRRWAVPDDGALGLSNSLAGVREAQVVVVFTERDDGTIDVGFRAAPGYDVSRVAASLGGGGHPQASGCTLPGDLEQVQDQVLAQVCRSLAEQRAARAAQSPSLASGSDA
ncbi:MAG: bifunctional oligoribonuclease/PAP phosphatase NrnA [Anaerolineae bacterium]|nr:bifunctional oligoribonuclease/PAP phosphatase NrnA [Anaerolineae bacterium]